MSTTETPLLLSEASGSGSTIGAAEHNTPNMNNIMLKNKSRASFGDVRMSRFSRSEDGENDDDSYEERPGLSESRKRTQRQNAILMESGIDIHRLRAAFSRLDVQGDGGLELFEFRCMWAAVFPQRPLDQDAWKTTEKMFTEMDVDGSGVITFEEIIKYLEINRKRELQKYKIPSTAREWVWQFVGNNNISRSWMAFASLHIKVCIYAWRSVSQCLMLLSVVIIFIESLPMYQSESEYPGTKVTFLLDVICNTFFTVEFILWIFSFPSPAPVVEQAGSVEDFDDKAETKTAYQCVNPAIVWQGSFWMEALALLSFYRRLLNFDHSLPTRSFAIFRMFRIMRAVRALRNFTKRSAMSRAPELGRALKKSFLSLLFLFILLFIVVTVSSAIMFFAEQHEASFDASSSKWVRNNNSQYNDAGEPTSFQSIPDALWWSIVTVTTVGYGDKVPSTIPGKIVAGFTMLAGLVVMSFPITILTSTFQAMEADRQDRETRLFECAEFYEGIKKWLDTGGVIKKTPSLSSVRLRKESMNVSSPMCNGGARVSFSGGEAEQLSVVLEAVLSKNIQSLEARLVKEISMIGNRVASLEVQVEQQRKAAAVNKRGNPTSFDL